MEGNNSSTKHSDLLQKIKEFTRSIVLDLSQGRSPSIVIDRFRNYCSNPDVNCFCNSDLPKGQEILLLQRECHVRRIDFLLRVLLIVQKLLQEKRHGSKRDIYYMHPSAFKEQAVVDRALNDICILMQCSRHNLNVVSVGKGLVMGWLRFFEDGKKYDCINCPSTAHPVPIYVEEVTDIVSTAQFILVVEKESVFHRLANDRFCHMNRCIVVTGRGYPDIPTRRFLRVLTETLHLPIYCLVDCDPYGFDILTTYRFGSMQLAYDAESLRIPEVRWLGVFPSDSAKYCLPQHCLLPLTTEDKRKIEAMLPRCYLHWEVPQWRLELELMLHRGVKYEIEALSVHSLSFLSEVYLPSKIQGVFVIFFFFFTHNKFDSMDTSVEMSCVMKVNIHCDECKKKMMTVLHNLQGVYSVVLEGEQAIVKIKGTVHPDLIWRVIERSSKHGQVTNFKLDGKIGVGGNSYYGPNDYPPYEPQFPPHLRGPGPEYRYYPPGQYLPPPRPPPLPYGLWPRPPYPLPPLPPPRHNWYSHY